MLQTLKLLLPALIPSWNFFDIIAPSPRVQFTLLNTEDDSTGIWHEFRPRPAHLSIIQMLGRMIWNPEWNESLFITSCAERLLEHPTKHSEDEILNRILRHLPDICLGMDLTGTTHLQFRLLLIQKKDAKLTEDIAFYSRTQPLPELNTA